jgi:Ca-activated chloride channel family protein
MMVYQAKYLAIFGVIGFIFWAINFYRVFNTSELYVSKSLFNQTTVYRKLPVFIIGLIAWCLISYSLMLPRIPLGYQTGKVEVNDIFFVVDVSRSMTAVDFKPNRLEAAKKKILDFVELRPKDRIGVIIFSEKAFTLLPLSIDINLVKQIVDDIHIGGMLGSGTNIGDALGLAIARGAKSLAKSKIIILLTDGVSNVGSMTPIQAAEQSKKQKIKIYTIGIGGNKNARMPIGKGLLGQRYANIPGGSIDFNTLEQISKITGAKSYVAGNIEALKNVLLEIEKLERTEIDNKGQLIYEEKYLLYLIFGFFTFLLAELFKKLWLREVT